MAVSMSVSEVQSSDVSVFSVFNEVLFDEVSCSFMLCVCVGVCSLSEVSGMCNCGGLFVVWLHLFMTVLSGDSDVMLIDSLFDDDCVGVDWMLLWIGVIVRLSSDVVGVNNGVGDVCV